MRHADIVPCVILRSDFAGEWESGVFRDRQCIELSPQHHGRTVSIFQNANDSDSANSSRYFVAELAKLSRDLCSRCILVKRKLGMLVQIDVERFGLRVRGLDLSSKARAALRVERGAKQQRQCTRSIGNDVRFHVTSELNRLNDTSGHVRLLLP